MNSGGKIDEAGARAAIARCRQIAWQPDPRRLGSQAALMREFLRRAAVVSQTMAGNTDWRWDDFTQLLPLPLSVRRSLPAYVFLDKELRYEQPGADPLEDEVIALNKEMNERRINAGWYSRKACWWSIRWASVKTHRYVVSLGLPDPYEPLIVFYERGGSFYREQGILYMDGANVMERAYQDLPPLPLDPAALDALDTLEPYAWIKTPSA